MSNIKYWVWLSSIPSIGAKKAMELLKHFGDPENLWHASKNDLIKFKNLKPVQINQILSSNYRDEAEKHLENMHKHGIYLVRWKDSCYPEMLKNIYDPPIVLYVKGKLKNVFRMVAIVGSRRATTYGKEITERISYELARYGIGITSGMARGIDTCAHNGALKAGGYTIAVLGCGLDKAYPEENEILMNEIISKEGAVISEYPPGTLPKQYNFPARNRIISGLSDSVIVVEAGEKSGSLITANLAAEQGREVFAVPGNINSKYSRGTNKLIKDGACVFTDLSDIIDDIKYTANLNDEDDNILVSNIINKLEGNERIIAECLKNEALHIDAIASGSGLDMNTVNTLLIIMEMKGIIKQLPGKMFKIK